MEKSGLHTIPSEKVDAPLFEEFPVAMECRLIRFTEDGNAIGQIVNVCADERVLDKDGKISLELFQPISFEPVHNRYHVLGEAVGNAFQAGNKLK